MSTSWFADSVPTYEPKWLIDLEGTKLAFGELTAIEFDDSIGGQTPNKESIDVCAKPDEQLPSQQ